MAGTQIFGQLIRAQLEQSASDLTSPATGTFYWNTGSSVAKIYAGATWKTLFDLDTAQTAINKTFTSPIFGTAAWFKTAAEARFYNAGDTFYVGFKGPNAAANKIWTLPLVDGSASQFLQTDGAGTLIFATALANPMTTASDIVVGGASGVATRLGTNLLGRFQVEYTTGTATCPVASPGIVTYTAHGRNTGDRCYFTTTGALPTGLAVISGVNNVYWITKIDANTFKLSTTLANLIAGTFINFTGSPLGTHTIYVGGIDATTGILGDMSGAARAAGYAAQLITAAGSGSVGTTSAYWDAASITLTPGTFLLSGAIQFIKGAATYTFPDFITGFGQTTGNSATGMSYPQSATEEYLVVSATFSHYTQRVGPVLVRFDGTTLTLPSGATMTLTSGVLYLKGNTGTYATATPTYVSSMSAVRMV